MYNYVEQTIVMHLFCDFTLIVQKSDLIPVVPKHPVSHLFCWYTFMLWLHLVFATPSSS